MILSLLLALPILADIPVSTPVLRPATGVQRRPALASNGSDAYAAWEDERGMKESRPSFFEPDIYAARILADGTPGPDLDVSPNADQNWAPAPVWNGEDYVLAHLVLAPDYAFRGIRFSSSKQERLITPAEFAPGLNLAFASALSLAWNGQEYLAVMSASPSSDIRLYGLLVDRSFHPIESAFPIVSGSVALGAVESDGHDFLVTWTDANARRINIANVSPSGAVVIHPPLNDPPPANSPVFRPAAVWDGRRYLVTWSDPVLRARFVEANGTPSSPVLDLAPLGGNTDVAWNGRQYLLPFVRSDGQGVLALRLDSEGRPLDAQPFVVSSAVVKNGGLAVVAMGNRFLVAWADEESIGASLVSGSTAAPPMVLARSLGSQSRPSGLFDGTNYAFTWLEEGTTYFGRVTLDGRQLDGGGIAVGTGYGSLLAFDGRQYLVNIGRHVVRIDRDGNIVSDTDTALLLGESASDGRDVLLLGYQYPYIRPVLLVDGVLLVQPAIDETPFSALAAAIAWNGSHYVVVYMQPVEPDCYKCGRRYDVRTVLLDRGGRVASPIRTILASRLPIFYFSAVSVTSGGGSTLAVFSDGLTTWVTSIDGEGVPRPPGKLPDFFSPNDLVWSGSYFLNVTGNLAWRIASDSQPLGSFAIGPAGAGDVTFVRGAPRLTIVYTRRVPIAGAGTITRVFFDFVPEVRRRAR